MALHLHKCQSTVCGNDIREHRSHFGVREAAMLHLCSQVRIRPDYLLESLRNKMLLPWVFWRTSSLHRVGRLLKSLDGEGLTGVSLPVPLYMIVFLSVLQQVRTQTREKHYRVSIVHNGPTFLSGCLSSYSENFILELELKQMDEDRSGLLTCRQARCRGPMHSFNNRARRSALVPAWRESSL